MDRLIFDDLVTWKDSSDRKPLLLEGVRQCGKTYILKEFGSREFEDSVYCNFEEDPRLGSVFSSGFDPETIVRDLGLLLNTKITPGRTLLILDEIQECDSAITSLKYFHERMPELHVVCAGSLLGVIKSKASFPVGKVDTRYLYPMTFCEFLAAEGETSLAEFVLSDPPADEVSEPIHNTLLRLLRDYCIVGGMPAVVKSWVEEHDILKVDRLQRELLDNYGKDFAKHGGGMIEMLTAIWGSLPTFLSRENHKFVFKQLKKDGRADDFREPIQWLVNARLVHKVDMVRGHGFPPSADEDPDQYKLYACDVGLLRAMSGHPAGIMLTEDDDTHLYKGGMYENLAVCELVSAGSGRLFYWREGRYEVDLIAGIGGRTVPIEVKSGMKTSSESLNRYQSQYGVGKAVVVSMNPPKDGDRERVPFYALCNLPGRGGSIDLEDYVNVSGLPYEQRFDVGDWVGEGDGFILVIPAARHHRGRNPRCDVQVWDGGAWAETHVSLTVSDDGDITLNAGGAFRGRAIVRNRIPATGPSGAPAGAMASHRLGSGDAGSRYAAERSFRWT